MTRDTSPTSRERETCQELLKEVEPEVAVKRQCKRNQSETGAPDGGWGWVVCFACFITHAVSDGIMYSFGILYIELLDHFKSSKADTAWIASLTTGICFLTGPITAILANRFGCRAITIVGSFLTSGGMIISIFAPNVYFLYFTFGVMTGLGYGMMYLPSVVCVSQYFDKRRALATGLGVCGTGIGTFIFSPVTYMLIRNYAWQGTLLIQAGLMLNCIPCGLVYLPINLTPIAKKTETDIEIVSDDTDRDLVPKKVDHAEEEIVERYNNFDAKLTVSDGVFCDKTALSADSLTIHLENNKVPLDNLNTLSTLEDSNICDGYAGNMKYCEGVLKSPDNISLVDGVTKHSSSTSDAKLSENTGLLNAVWKSFRESFDVKIFRNAPFCMFVIATFFYGIGYYTPYVYLPDKALNTGVATHDAAWLISTVGITNTVGRVVFGYLADKSWVNRLMLYNTALVICGVATVLVAFMGSYGLLMTYSVVYGLFSGVTISLTTVLIADFVGIASLSEALGVTNFAGGVSTLVGPPWGGWLYDITQSYDASFIGAGVCITVGGAMLYLVPCIKRWTYKEKS